MKRNLGILVSIGLALATVARAGVYGSNPTVNFGHLDTCSGCIFTYVDFPGTEAGQQVFSYSFYAGATGNKITPILFESTGGSNFKIIGIGTTQTPSATGTNTFSFGLTTGTATIMDANTSFGWLDGSPGGGMNTGTITNNGVAGPGPGNYFSYFPSPTVTVGETVAFQTFTGLGQGQNTRTYSLDVTTTSFTSVPEPGFYCAFGAGLIGLLVVRRRKIA